ncbi:hypothetical protein A2U01_0090305, partial [Trifolium medium]|nr:hypothetical protein [Trifolium medium]
EENCSSSSNTKEKPKSWADIYEEEDLQRKKNDKKFEEEINNHLQEAKNGQLDQQKDLVDE